jgi:hypothetical protein
VSLKVFSKALNYIDISLIFDFVTYSLYICVYEKVLFLDFDGVMCLDLSGVVSINKKSLE